MDLMDISHVKEGDHTVPCELCLEAFWPGPLSIVGPARHELSAAAVCTACKHCQLLVFLVHSCS